MAARLESDRAIAIAALLTEFCWCVDNGQGELVANLFVEEATVDAPHFNLAGRPEIHAWFAGRSGTKLSRHCWSNLRITPAETDRYRVESNLMTSSGVLPAPQHQGRMAVCSSIDEVVFENGAALFASRTLAIIFEGAIIADVVPA